MENPLLIKNLNGMILFLFLLTQNLVYYREWNIKEHPPVSFFLIVVSLFYFFETNVYEKDEIMLALCRGDQEDELEALLGEGECDVSFTDGAGNSAAHIA